MELKRKKAGRPALDKDSPSTLCVKLHTYRQRSIFYTLGKGNISRGIRLAADLIENIFNAHGKK